MTVAAVVVAGMLAAQAGAPQTFSVGAGPATQSINRLAAQARVDVAITADLNGRSTPGLRGRMTVDAAFERLLRPVGARAVRIGEDAYRIEAAPPRTAPAATPTPPITTQLSEILVTAAPPVGLSQTSGHAPVDNGALQRFEGAATSDAVADLTATVDSTRQGTGRNKLFVRGLADSAMNGPLQATVGQYLGDLRLSFGSPDPDLALVDIRRIEVFEGPQGTRFGVGAIGGVLRIEPAAPELDAASGRLILGGAATSGGGGSGDVAVVLNQPFGDQVAGRVAAYARREGGILDNPTLDLRNADYVDTTGARGTLRWTNGDWTVDVVGVAQKVHAGDAQTIAVDNTRLLKTGRVREPYSSTIALAGVTARRWLGSARLTSATSVSRHTLDERFDATLDGEAFPIVVDRKQTASTTSSELRIDMAPSRGLTWSGGAAIAFGETKVERQRQTVMAALTPTYSADLKRTFAEATAFGEASVAPAPNWRLAVGARLSGVRIDNDIRVVAVNLRARERDRRGVNYRLSPSLSARWDVTPETTVFARLEQAVRPAGVNEADGAFARYQGDRVTLLELGARTYEPWHGLTGEVSAGWMDWRDVQADIITPGGDMVTDNVGDGVIKFVSLKAAWRPTDALDVSGGLFLNQSQLTPTRIGVIGAGKGDIPNVAPVGGQVSFDYQPGLVTGLPLRLGADFRYVGRSRLGVGVGLDVPQGGYLLTALTARLGDDHRAFTLRITNPMDVAGIRYGIGSPYQLSQPQVAPLRPLTVRLGFEAAF
nr:TonB-dependent receptor [uncultured Brevundimonas sp.]